MKNTISVTILLTLLLIPRADAQQEYIVRTVYFQPTDSKDRSEWLDLDSIMKSIQDTYQSEMERHGFSGKIFRLETDQDGKVIVHKIKGRHNKAHYSGDTLPIVIEELESKGYNNRQSIYVIVMAGMQALWHNFAGGIATARPSGGWVGNSEYYGFCASVETSRGQVEDVIRHELGHTFGLQHIALYDPSDFIMGSGDTLSFHEARWLSRNHYFNRVWNYNLAPDLTEFHGAEVFENDKIRFRATASDESSMFQAYGFVSTNIVGWNFFEAASDFGVIATIDFTDIDRVHLNADKIYFQLMDADGNWRYHNPKTYTLPERHSDTPVNDRKQSPDCVLCDLGGFQRDLSDELNDLLNPREDIALTFEYAAENALTPINSSREWDGWVIGVWEKQPDRLVPAKSPYYFNFPEMNDLSHWMYSHAPSKIVYDVSDKECKSFGTYFILPQSCTKGMEFTAHADDIEIFAQDM